MRQNFKTTLAIVVVLLGLVNGNFNLVTLLIDCTDDKIELKLDFKAVYLLGDIGTY